MYEPTRFTISGGSRPCLWCSGGQSAVYHSGKCPRVKAIEYHTDGTTKRVEFHDEASASGGTQ